jgi:hypothetical protein
MAYRRRGRRRRRRRRRKIPWIFRKRGGRRL